MVSGWMGGGREEGVGGETVAGLDGLEVCRICGYRHTHIDVYTVWP